MTQEHSIPYFKCNYERCIERAVYTLEWDAYDQHRQPLEWDLADEQDSCEDHLVDIVKNHEFALPTRVTLFGRIQELPEVLEKIRQSLGDAT